MRRHWLPVGLTALIGVAATAWAWRWLWHKTPATFGAVGDDHEILGTSVGYLHVWVQGSSLLDVTVSTYVDHLAAVLMVLASGVALLVQVYSTAYLGHHARYRSYALIIVLFLLGMLAVVTADDLFVLLVGWEVMGLCSYLLISHEWEAPAARAGAVKAFLMTRFGDVGLLLAIIVIGQTYGTYRISSIVFLGGDHHRHATTIGLLLLLAVVGKSAQFPLHTWLPDAMPGPTPISALIHAATMVAAGVYLVARLYPLFAASQLVMTLLAVIACITMLLGALFALVQSDLKRALAWSTVSQLAYMFAALASGDADAATDHLLSHGAFKALLFLGAGCLMHAVGSSALSDMGGLRLRMPVTFWTMTVGFAALAGIVPTAGFFTKDEIVEAAHHAASGHGPIGSGVGWLVLLVSLLTAVVTATYAMRLWLVTFLEPPGEAGRPARDAHDAPAVMTVPLVILAVATLGLSIGAPFHLGVALLTTALSAIGLWAGWQLWHGRWRVPAAHLFEDELGFDRLAARALPAATGVVARAAAEVEVDGIDAYSRGVGRLAGLVSRGTTSTQSRNAQRYASILVAGVVLLAALAVIAVQGGLS